METPVAEEVTVPTTIPEAFLALAKEARELYVPQEVRRIQHAPSPLEFYREHVASNLPLIIEEGATHWPALTKWTNAYLTDKLKDVEVTVDFSADGYSDAIRDNRFFVTPESRKMGFSRFLALLLDRNSKGVPYIQHQNGNFTAEFEELWEDVDTDVPWATEAFGVAPDVANLWIGDERSVTSLHKDHYENIYYVVAGAKEFTLYPPTDFPFLYERTYRAATYTRGSEDEDFAVVENDPPSSVPWLSVDPDRPDYEAYPLFRHATPLRCVVHAGEALYLPSLWFHHVKQHADAEGRCIAVNFWYDMQYDVKYNYYKFLENLTSLPNAEEAKP